MKAKVNRFVPAQWVTPKTRFKMVRGAIAKDEYGLLQGADISVRVTADNIGKSLSLAIDDEGIMLLIPIEAVSDMIEVVMPKEKNNEKN